MKIIVLAGGISTEREVSIVTGSEVCRALRGRGHDAAVLDVYFGTAHPEWVFAKEYPLEQAIAEMKENTALISQEKQNRKSFWGEHVVELCQKADIVFMALHGENGENGKVQAAFDLFGIRYTGSGYLGSALAMDKGLTKKMLEQGGVPTPKGLTLHKDSEEVRTGQIDITFPCIVKPACGGSSIGVSVASDREGLAKALDEAFAYEDTVVVEQFIRGREFSVGVVQNEAYPIIEIVPKEGFYDYHNKYQPGATQEFCPAHISGEMTRKMQGYALCAARILMLDKYSRIDFLMDEEENIYCLEANTLPGMTPTSLLPQEAAVLGMDYGMLCEKLIEVSDEKY